MADNNESKTSRLTDQTSGKLVDNAIRDIEAVFRLVFGLPADTVLSEAMDIASDGDVTMTGSLTLAGAPTEDLMAATKAYVDAATAEVGLTGAIVSRAAAQTITKNLSTAFIFTSEDKDSHTFVDLGAQATRVTIPAGQGGWYRIFGKSKAGTGSPMIYLNIRVNGSPIWQKSDYAGGIMPYNAVETVVELSAADYVELWVYSNIDPSSEFTETLLLVEKIATS